MTNDQDSDRELERILSELDESGNQGTGSSPSRVRGILTRGYRPYIILGLILGVVLALIFLVPWDTEEAMKESPVPDDPGTTLMESPVPDDSASTRPSFNREDIFTPGPGEDAGTGGQPN